MITNVHLPTNRKTILGKRPPVLAVSVTAILFAFLMTATPTSAQQIDLDVTFLAVQTEWCPENNGVPMIVKMDGPDIIRGPDDFPRKVTIRRGNDEAIVNGENIASFNYAEDVLGKNAEPIGRFSANFEACMSAFSYSSSANGSWTLTGPEGEILQTGAIKDKILSLPLLTPLFYPMSGPSDAYYAQFGDSILFTLGTPQAKTKQTFLAEPDKE